MVVPMLSAAWGGYLSFSNTLSFCGGRPDPALPGPGPLAHAVGGRGSAAPAPLRPAVRLGGDLPVAWLSTAQASRATPPHLAGAPAGFSGGQQIGKPLDISKQGDIF